MSENEYLCLGVDREMIQQKLIEQHKEILQLHNEIKTLRIENELLKKKIRRKI